MPLNVLYIVVRLHLATCLMFQFLDLLVVMSYSAVASDFSSSTFKDKKQGKREKKKKKFLSQEFFFFFEDFPSYISRLLLSTCCLRMIRSWKIFLFFDGFPLTCFSLCSEGLKKCQNPFILFPSFWLHTEAFLSILHHPSWYLFVRYN